MNIIGLVVVLIVVGIVLQLIKEYVEPKIYLTAVIVIILAVALLILKAVGVFDEALRLGTNTTTVF